MKYKLSFFIVWFTILLSGPLALLSVIKNLDFTQYTPQLINVFQRITGLIAFSLLFVQIILSTFMQKWIEKLGAWIFKFHIIEGVFVYGLIIVHPLLFVLFNLKASGVIDPFYVFTDFCLLCSRPIELYYTFGRVAFWLISLAVLARILRAETWWKENWRKFQFLNYVAFFLVAGHAFFVGTDIDLVPFSYFYWFAIATIVSTLVYKLFLRRS